MIWDVAPCMSVADVFGSANHESIDVAVTPEGIRQHGVPDDGTRTFVRWIDRCTYVRTGDALDVAESHGQWDTCCAAKGYNWGSRRKREKRESTQDKPGAPATPVISLSTQSKPVALAPRICRRSHGCCRWC